MTTTAEANTEQATFWNEQGGPRWVQMERDLDAQLEPFGRAVAEKLALRAGESVLDVGCGGGGTSSMLARAVQPGSVLGVDISAPLVARARERAAGITNLRFELGDAQVFPFERGAYDVVFSRFGVMFFADPVAAFANMRTALRANGRIGFVCWRPVRDNPAFVLPLEAALPLLPEPPTPAEPGAPGPFAFADGERVRSILERAGYVNVEVAAQDIDIVYAGRPDLDGAVELALQIGPLSRALPALDPALLPRVRDAVREAFRPHLRPAGVTLPTATWLVTARNA